MVIGDLGTLGSALASDMNNLYCDIFFFFNFCQDLKNFQKLNFDS